MDTLITFLIKLGYYRYGINANYQSTISLDGGLDGREETSNTDIYTYFSIGIRYQFGPMGLSTKTLY
ncbi:hypothetical protein [Pedobacter panaciterrae]